jgi:hypothetical protein
VAGIDVAGEDEGGPAGEAIRVSPRRDSTVLTLAYAAQHRVGERALEPRFAIVRQYAWRGDRHRELYPRVLALTRGGTIVGQALEVGRHDARHALRSDGRTVTQLNPAEAGGGSGVDVLTELESERQQHLDPHGDR